MSNIKHFVEYPSKSRIRQHGCGKYEQELIMGVTVSVTHGDSPYSDGFLSHKAAQLLAEWLDAQQGE